MRTDEAILRALEKGPMYEVFIPLVVGKSIAHVRRVLLWLEYNGRVTHDGQTWSIVP